MLSVDGDWVPGRSGDQARATQNTGDNVRCLHLAGFRYCRSMSLNRLLLLLAFVTGCGGASFTAGSPDGGTTRDASRATGEAGAASREGGAPDAGLAGNGRSLPCGGKTCAIPGEACCVFANQNPPPDFSYACVNGSTCPAAGGDSGVAYVAALQCTSAASCAAGEVCCMYQQQSPHQVVSQCMASCSGPGQAQLCDLNVPASQSGCPASAPCSSSKIGDWNLPNTLATCGGVGS